MRRVPALPATLLAALLGTGLAALGPGAAVAAPAATAEESPAALGTGGQLYLVTLDGSGVDPRAGFLERSVETLRLVQQQDTVLGSVAGPAPVYRWTNALNGFAVELDDEQAGRLSTIPGVVSVEPNELRTLTALPSGRRRAGVDWATRGPRHGGSGVVIGVVDSGIAPANPVFALRSGAGRPDSFGGPCVAAEAWSPADCSGKVVGARWYVDGFGADAVNAAAALSPFDTEGHGTQMASVAAGNAGVPVRVAGDRLGRFGGLAPDARLAVYKACWTAPDPVDDGCATADLVTAVDDATRDGVDVLSLAVGGPPAVDTLERALLGATEAGVVVVASAGNDGAGAVAHTSPWVTTVGGATGDVHRGRVLLPDGSRLGGAMLSTRSVGPAPAVIGREVATPGAADDARYCVPGSLDAAEVAGGIVVCERGRVGRVDKSRAVALADGVAMVLVNSGPGSVDPDVHSVPTVHLAAGPGRRLLRLLDGTPRLSLALRPLGLVRERARVAGWSGSANPSTGVIKPDVVAPATGVIAAESGRLGAWDFVTGTSAATAHTAGVAAVLLGRGLTPGEVRSALVTSAGPVGATSLLRSGGGLVRPRPGRAPVVAYLEAPGAYRAWLDGARTGLNTPLILLAGGAVTARRTLTNVSGRSVTLRSQARGLRHDVVVRPAVVRLAPGESVTYRVRVTGRGGARLDDGFVQWRTARTTLRTPLVIAR